MALSIPIPDPNTYPKTPIVGNRPASKELRSGTHKQTNLGYAKLVAENHILAAHRTATARATRDGSEPEAGDDVPESDLSTYEREREENIKANLEQLKELGLRTDT